MRSLSPLSTRVSTSTSTPARRTGRTTGCGPACSCGGTCGGRSKADAAPDGLAALRGAKTTGARPRAAAPWYVTASTRVGRGTGLTPDGVNPATWDQGTNVSTNDDSATDMTATNWSNMDPAQQRATLERIGKAAGKDDASIGRMITDLVGRGFSTVQGYLHDQAGVEIQRIQSDAAVTIARINARGGLTNQQTLSPQQQPNTQTSQQPVTTATDGGSGTLLAVGALALVLLGSKRGRR